VKPYRAWKGALELEFKTDAGSVPMSISIELYARVKKTRSASFTTLAPSGQPVEQKRIDPKTGKEFSGSRKGVKVGKDFVPMTDEAIEKINSGTKTKVLKPEAFCPLTSVELELAIDRFYVRPQKDVAGADQSLNIVWNGLLSTGLAWCTQMSITGGHDAILVVYAKEDGLYAALLPFEAEVYPAPSFEFTRNEKAGNLFAAMVEQEHEPAPFEHASWQSEYRARREAAIAAVVAGQEVEEQPEPAPVEDKVPDLMAALEASLQQSKKTTKPKKAVPKRKAAA
jgi:DNA end-binding protein Ku